MIEVGDLVQVEIGGVLVLPEPTEVLSLHEYCGDSWAFIEGSSSGVLLQNLIPVEK